MAELTIGYVVGRLASYLEKEAVALYEFRDQVEKMRNELKGIQCFLKDADSRSARDEIIRNWVNEMRQVDYDIEDVIDLFFVRVESWYNEIGLKGKAKMLIHKPKVIIECRKINTKIEKIKKKMEEINERKDRLSTPGIDEGGDPRRDTLLETRRRDACEDQQNDVVGLEEKISSLVKRLVEGDARRCVISVVGQAGLGKTVLARNVYNRAKQNFCSSAWIHVANHNPNEVLRELCKAVLNLRGHEVEKLDKDEMRLEIPRKLKGNKYLVVLDDIQTYGAWDAIRGALPEGNDRSRVLMTTHYVGLAKHADVHTPPYKLLLLNHEDSYKLLCRNAFPRYPESCPQELKSLANDIVKRCGCLPLALVAVGRILSAIKPTVKIGLDFVEGFNYEITRHNNGFSSILALNFEYLHYDLKPCLMYCCAFPGAMRSKSGDSLRLWIAEGFVKKQGDRRPEAVATHYLNEFG